MDIADDSFEGYTEIFIIFPRVILLLPHDRTQPSEESRKEGNQDMEMDNVKEKFQRRLKRFSVVQTAPSVDAAVRLLGTGAGDIIMAPFLAKHLFDELKTAVSKAGLLEERCLLCKLINVVEQVSKSTLVKNGKELKFNFSI